MRKSLGAMLLLIGVVAVSVASAQSLPSADPGEVGISTDRLQRIADALNRDIEDSQLPGAVVAVARNGLVVYFEAFGFLDKEAGIPMPKDAIFRIYSMTKPLTTVAAMILVEQGRLQLTDPVSKFFPTFSNLKVSIPKTDASGNASYELVSAKREMTVHTCCAIRPASPMAALPRMPRSETLISRRDFMREASPWQSAI